MTCSVDIIPTLIHLKFEYHDFLLLKNLGDELYESVLMDPSAPIQRIPQPWESSLNKYGLLGLINMPHFGRLNEAHACVKQLLAYFHGGMLWLNEPIPVMVDLIANIMGLSKAGEDLTQYIGGRDTNKKLVKQLKERFGLHHDGRAYHVDNINA